MVESERIKRRGLEVEFTIPIFDFGAVGRPQRAGDLHGRPPTAWRSGPSTSAPRRARPTCATAATTTSPATTRAASCRLQKTIQDEALLQYSGMLVDVSQLIIDARARILSNVDAINARRDFWIAATDLKAALVGGGAGERRRRRRRKPWLPPAAAVAAATDQGETRNDRPIAQRLPRRRGPRPRRRLHGQRARAGREHARGADHDRSHDAAAARPDERARTTSRW